MTHLLVPGQIVVVELVNVVVAEPQMFSLEVTVKAEPHFKVLRKELAVPVAPFYKMMQVAVTVVAPIAKLVVVFPGTKGAPVV
jgi:hypothetical protein